MTDVTTKTTITPEGEKKPADPAGEKEGTKPIVNKGEAESSQTGTLEIKKDSVSLGSKNDRENKSEAKEMINKQNGDNPEKAGGAVPETTQDTKEQTAAIKTDRISNIGESVEELAKQIDDQIAEIEEERGYIHLLVNKKAVILAVSGLMLAAAGIVLMLKGR